MDDPSIPTGSEPLTAHAAALTRSFAEKLSSAAGFLRSGDSTRANAILITRNQDIEAWKSGLIAQGLPDGDETFSIIPVTDWLPPRGVNSVRMARRLFDRIEATRAEQRELYVAIDFAWALETGTPSEDVCHWEATCDHLLATEKDVKVLCIYGLHELGFDFLHAGLRTHRVIMTGSQSFPNPFFEAPAILEKEPDLNQCSDDKELVAGMLQRFLAAV